MVGAGVGAMRATGRDIVQRANGGERFGLANLVGRVWFVVDCVELNDGPSTMAGVWTACRRDARHRWRLGRRSGCGAGAKAAAQWVHGIAIVGHVVGARV